MKEFNLKLALAGEPVVTRAGIPMSQLHMFTGTQSAYPLVGVMGNANIEFFTVEGYYQHNLGRDTSPKDLFMADKTIMVNGFEINAGETVAPDSGTDYYTPAFGDPGLSVRFMFCGSESDRKRLSRGVVHLYRADAIAHAKAMLGVNPRKSTDAV